MQSKYKYRSLLHLKTSVTVVFHVISGVHVLHLLRMRQESQNTDLTDSVHSAAYSGTMSIELCHPARVSGTMKLVFHIFSRSKFSMEHQFHCAAGTGGMAYVYRPSAAVGGGMDEIR